MVDVYVAGDELPALAAALEFAEVGLSVRISLGEDAGGSAGSWEHDVLDPHGVPDAEGALAEFLTHVSSPLTEGAPAADAIRPVSMPPRPVLLRGATGEWTRQPTPAVLGIPAVPMSVESLAVLGGAGAARAYLDRIKPVLTIGKTHELGALVRSRLGRAALDRLVEPLVRERFGVAADEVDVAIAAPGLNESLTRTGSLSGAVLAYADRGVARETGVMPEGGWEALRAVLLGRLSLYDVEVGESGVRALRAERDGWRVEERDGEAVSVRALVVSAAAMPSGSVPGEAAEVPSTLLPELRRIRAAYEIEDPGLPAGEAGPAVQTVALEGGDPWSVRFERDGRARWWARVSGPASARPALEALAALEAAGARRREGGSSALSVCAAPYASTARRDAGAARLTEARDAEPSFLPVGALLHGDDLASAVEHARADAVALRRRLTGIAS